MSKTIFFMGPQNRDSPMIIATLLNIDGFDELAIRFRHALKAGTLPGGHRDPFDRMIAAQAILSDLSVLTCDPEIAALGAKTAW